MKRLAFLIFTFLATAATVVAYAAEKQAAAPSGPDSADAADAVADDDRNNAEGGVASIDSTNCIRCHGNKGMKPRSVRADKLPHLLYVDKDRFAQSVHGQESPGMGCTDCHDTGFDRYPHKDHHSQTCMDCHEEAFAQIKAQAMDSVHFKTDKATFNCGVCHEAHYMQTSANLTLAQKNAMCISCHNDRFNDSKLTLKQRHSWNPLAALHLDNTACIACHTQPEKDIPAAAFKHRILPHDKATRACEDCHVPDGKMLNYLSDLGEKPKTGMTQEQLLSSYYIAGATRIPWLDWLGIALLVMVAGGVLGHGGLRVLASLIRSTKKG